VDKFDQFLLFKDALLFIVAAGAGIRYWIRRRRATSWPSTQGTVMSANASDRQPYRHSCLCVLSYSYAVNGDYYSGSHSIHARNERRADELATEWKGRSLVIRYSPSSHDVSVLLKDDQIGGMGD